MKLAVALTLALSAAASPSVRNNGGLAGPTLDHWPPDAARALDALIARNAHNNSYAVFDMDNTSYRYDIEEALIPYLENKGVLTRDTIDPRLILTPFKDGETLSGYYQRLCEIEDTLCYWFSAAVYSGIPLCQLKEYVDEVMCLKGPIKTKEWVNGTLAEVEIEPPKIFRGQVELYNRLMNNGIAVYVVSASAEEVVRMVASDPKYGYNVPPENVIGVTLLLNNTEGDLTTARKQITEGTYDWEANLGYTITPQLMAPGTWVTGKWAAILQYISMWKLPILVGGDTPKSDGPMIFHGINHDHGIKLWINRKASSMAEISQMNTTYSAEQAAEGRPVTANLGWVIVTPDDIL